MHLVFSHEEKALFLEKRGFEIRRLIYERDEFIHGSRFQTVVHEEVVAVSITSGVSGKVEGIFNQELKKALLSL